MLNEYVHRAGLRICTQGCFTILYILLIFFYILYSYTEFNRMNIRHFYMQVYILRNSLTCKASPLYVYDGGSIR